MNNHTQNQQHEQVELPVVDMSASTFTFEAVYELLPASASDIIQKFPTISPRSIRDKLNEWVKEGKIFKDKFKNDLPGRPTVKYSRQLPTEQPNPCSPNRYVLTTTALFKIGDIRRIDIISRNSDNGSNGNGGTNTNNGNLVDRNGTETESATVAWVWLDTSCCDRNTKPVCINKRELEQIIALLPAAVIDLKACSSSRKKQPPQQSMPQSAPQSAPQQFPNTFDLQTTDSVSKAEDLEQAFSDRQVSPTKCSINLD